MKPFRVLTFTSTHEAMSAEDALRAGGVAFEVVPTPKTVSAGCGLAMRVRAEDLEDALDAVESADIHVSHVVETDRR